jgi:hypothetical protein
LPPEREQAQQAKPNDEVVKREPLLAFHFKGAEKSPE